MLGKVHGPYRGKQGKQFVIILHHNIDGSVKSRKTMSYQLYLEEYDKGLHRYENYPKKIPKRHRSTKEELEQRKPLHVKCDYCKKDFIKKRYKLETVLYFCSDSCTEKYKRRDKKKVKVFYHNQFVIEINKNKPDKYFIIIENIPGNRKAYLVAKDKCVTVITDDANGVPKLKLHYKNEDAVLIKPVPGYKKIFWITETAVLVSRRTKTILSQTLGKTGYYCHATYINGKARNFKIHRLVAWAFIPNPYNKPEVNHMDGVKTHNHKDNLEWVTSGENTRHAFKNNLIPIASGENVGGAKLTNVQAHEMRALYKTGKYKRKELEKIFSVGYHVVFAVVNNRTYLK